jgi:hypothetical protein
MGADTSIVSEVFACIVATARGDNHERVVVCRHDRSNSERFHIIETSLGSVIARVPVSLVQPTLGT